MAPNLNLEPLRQWLGVLTGSGPWKLLALLFVLLNLKNLPFVWHV